MNDRDYLWGPGMTDEEKVEHYDMTKHTRYDECFPGKSICIECREINAMTMNPWPGVTD